MKKILCLVICFVFLMSLFAGCGNAAKTEQSAAESTQTATVEQSTAAKGEPTVEDSLKLPIVEPGSVTLTIGTFDNWYAPASYASNLPIFQEIEKKTGVKINWEVNPPAQWQTIMQTRLAAGGQDLPDFICVPWGDTMKDANAGLLMPIEDLVAKYAPDIVRLFNANPDVKALNYAPDGHMYKVSSVVSGSTYANPWLMSIRKDWLDKLSLKAPETIDDWYNVLKAFKDKDPNGNGKADEIPLDAVGVYYFSYLAQAWGLHSFYSNYMYPDKDGKIQAEITTTRYKEFLTWARKLYAEGLLNPEFATVDSEKQVANINRNVVGAVGTFISNIPSFNSNLKKSGVSDANYAPVLTPKGPYGDQFQEGYGPISGDFAILKNCKNPEVMIKWIDYVYAHPDGTNYCMFGVEGKSYTIENGKKKLTDFVMKNPDGLGPFEALRSLGSWPNIPYIQTEEAYGAILLGPYPELADIAVRAKPFIKLGIPPILATKDESEKQSAINADLTTYNDEMVLKFITGKEDLSKFDLYVKKLKDMGIDTLVKIAQDQWDRFQKQMASAK